MRSIYDTVIKLLESNLRKIRNGTDRSYSDKAPVAFTPKQAAEHSLGVAIYELREMKREYQAARKRRRSRKKETEIKSTRGSDNLKHRSGMKFY